MDIWAVLNAIFYVLVQGCKWRDLPGDFPAWQTVYTYFRNWRIDGIDMADHNFMAHNGSDGSSPFDPMQRAGYGFSSAAENVAA